MVSVNNAQNLNQLMEGTFGLYEGDNSALKKSEQGNAERLRMPIILMVINNLSH